MADVLSLLREYHINNKEINEVNERIRLGDFFWPKDVKTNYVIYNSGKDGNKKDYYTLESILFLLKKVSLTHPLYVRNAALENIPAVCRPDRKDLLSYLTGRIATSQNIDKSAPLDITLQIPSKVVKRGGAPAAHVTFDESKNTTDPTSKKPRLDDALKQTRTSRLDALLDGKPNEPSVITDSKSSLMQALPDDKIAAMRAKFIARRRKSTIQPVEEGREYEDGDENHVEDIKTEILSRERNWRTRSTVLQSGVKSFSKNVFAILSSIKAKEEGRGNNDNQPSSGSFATSVNSSVNKANMLAMAKKAQAPVAGYSRYDQERFRGKEETLGFKIDTTGTYHDMSLKSVMEGVATKKMPSIKSHPAMKPTKAIIAKPQKPMKRISRTPIIIIPAATTSLVTLYNVKDMLQDLKFIPTSVKKENGMRRDSEVLIQRRKDNGAASVPYRVIDNITKLQTHEEWDRVVGVFVQGPAWQFKGWPWLMQDGSPVDIFAKIQAFHVKFVEQKMDANVSRWNVHVMQLSENKRHMDRAVFYKFWEVLDKYMTKNKAHLRF